MLPSQERLSEPQRLRRRHLPGWRRQPATPTRQSPGCSVRRFDRRGQEATGRQSAGARPAWWFLF